MGKTMSPADAYLSKSIRIINNLLSMCYTTFKSVFSLLCRLPHKDDLHRCSPSPFFGTHGLSYAP